MTRAYVVVEGETEESFVKNVLAQVLWPYQVYLRPILLGPPRHKGGRTNYDRVNKHVVIQLKQDRTAYCSTMLDLYGLGSGFPGMPLPANLSNLDKVVRIEKAVKADIVMQVPDLRPDIRFVPYLQLHEYEGLLFSDPEAFASGIGQPHLAGRFETIRKAFPTPEDIDDDPNTAPSKRVLNAYPGYRKVLDGSLAAEAVGVDRMRQQCPHFREMDWAARGVGSNVATPKTKSKALHLHGIITRYRRHSAHESHNGPIQPAELRTRRRFCSIGRTRGKTNSRASFARHQDFPSDPYEFHG